MSSHDNVDPEDYYNTPMMKRMRNPVSPRPKKKEEPYDNPRHEFSFYQGITDEDNLALLNDDYYGYLGAMGFYNNKKLPRHSPLTFDSNTNTVLRFNDMSKQKTPIDKRKDVEPHLGQVALDIKNSELYKVQDFSEESEKRTIEKTHRILNDPTRRLQAQKLIEIQQEKSRLLDPRLKMHPLERMITYNQMMLETNIILLDRITDVLDYQEKIYTFNKFEVRPYGINFYAEMTLKNGAKATKLDFQDDTKNLNVPSNATMTDYPRHNLLSLQVIFDSGNQIYFATNKPSSSLETTVKLTNAVLPNTFTISPGQFSIKSLNIRADGGADGVVRLIGLY